MPSIEWYVSEDDPAPPRALLKAAARDASRGVYSGSINDDAPFSGSYYSDGERAAISSRTIAERADYSLRPDDVSLYEPESTGRGKGRTPQETERISLYSRARGAAFHARTEGNIDTEEAVRRELDTPTPRDTWKDVYETVAESGVAPKLEELGMSEDYRDALVTAATFEIFEASRILKDGGEDVESYCIGREIPFLVERGSRGGGRVDRVSVVDDKLTNSTRGVFAVEMKFADRIRPKHICRVESYRWAFSEFAHVEEALDAAVARVGIDAGECEVLTSLDAGWPEDAMNVWRQACYIL